ncbi:MAG: hypothetical protein IKB01_11980, partial [Lachnospiraceae bacterium]|nr:hypothetical protein [Lachnospiraceae bacterium]
MEAGVLTGNFHDAKLHRENRGVFMKEGYRRMSSAGFNCADLTVLCSTWSDYYTKPLFEAIADAKREREIAEAVGIRI